MIYTAEETSMKDSVRHAILVARHTEICPRVDGVRP